MATIEGFKKIFGEFKEVNMAGKEKFEITSRINGISDKDTRKRAFLLDINGQEEWASYWYEEGRDETNDIVQSFVKGDTVHFLIAKSGRWYNIEAVGKIVHVDSDEGGSEDDEDLPASPKAKPTQPSSPPSRSDPQELIKARSMGVSYVKDLLCSDQTTKLASVDAGVQMMMVYGKQLADFILTGKGGEEPPF